MLYYTQEELLEKIEQGIQKLNASTKVDEQSKYLLTSLNNIKASIVKGSDNKKELKKLDSILEAVKANDTNVEVNSPVTVNNTTTVVPVNSKGKYQKGVTYSPGDLVSYMGNSYMSLGKDSKPNEKDWTLIGEKGIVGKQGKDGEDGLQGPRGYIGLAGKDGKDGIGKDGKDGSAGEKGEKGEKGEDGKDGKKGNKGDKGVSGKTGEAGPRGVQGNRGRPGSNGEGVPAGGSIDQVLVKSTGDDYDTEWIDGWTKITVSSSAPLLPATGDLWVDTN